MKKWLLIVLTIVFLSMGSAYAEGVLCYGKLTGMVKYEVRGVCGRYFVPVPLPEPVEPTELVKPDLLYSDHWFGDTGGWFNATPPPDPIYHQGFDFGAQYTLMRNADGTPIRIGLFSNWYTFTWVYSYKLVCVNPDKVDYFPAGTPICE